MSYRRACGNSFEIKMLKDGFLSMDSRMYTYFTDSEEAVGSGNWTVMWLKSGIKGKTSRRKNNCVKYFNTKLMPVYIDGWIESLYYRNQEQKEKFSVRKSAVLIIIIPNSCPYIVTGELKVSYVCIIKNLDNIREAKIRENKMFKLESRNTQRVIHTRKHLNTYLYSYANIFFQKCISCALIA